MTSQGSPHMRFRRALDRGNVTEALSSASELEHVGLTEALGLCLLLRDKAPERYPRAALRWHGRLCREVDLSLEEAQAILAALVLMAGDRKGNAAFALADLLSRRALKLLDTCRLGPGGVELLERGQAVREPSVSVGDKLKNIGTYVRKRWRSTDPDSYDQYRRGRERTRKQAEHTREAAERQGEQEREDAERGREYVERYKAERAAAEKKEE